MTEHVRILNEAKKRYEEEFAKKTIELEAKADASKTKGFFQKMALDKGFNEILTYAKLYEVHTNKTHQKLGMTWEKFCETYVIGASRRTIENILKDLKPIYDNFSGNFTAFVGVPLSKVRYLGRELSSKPATFAGFEDGDIIIDGIKIPLSAENKDEIEAGIDALKAANEEEKEKVKKLEKNIERTVKEETRGLTAERDLLIQENKRLNAFCPDNKEPSEWSLEQAKAVDDACAAFEICVRSFVFDKRLKGEFKLQAQVEAALNRAERSIRGLIRQWYEEIDPQTEAF